MALRNIGTARATATVRSRARRANITARFHSLQTQFLLLGCAGTQERHQRRSGFNELGVAHCTKTVVIVCGCFVAFLSCNALNTRNHVGVGAPVTVVKAPILCSKPAYSAAPAPFGVLLGA